MLQVTPYKMKLNIAISGTHEIHHIFCDPFDTIDTIYREYPLFMKPGSPHWLALEHTNYFNIDHSLHFRRLGPLHSVARFHRPTWTLVRGMESQKGNGKVETPGEPIPHPGTNPFQDDIVEHPKSSQDLDDKITIAIFHPFTNKFTIEKLPPKMCVAEVLDCLEPPVPSTVPIVVEHNAKRLDLTVQLGQLPPKSTLRFRHYSGLGGMDPEACLRTELLARGVPPKQITSRVSSVITAVGEAPLREAFLQTDPWAKVKEHCNSHNVRLILPSELKDYQQQRRMKSR